MSLPIITKPFEYQDEDGKVYEGILAYPEDASSTKKYSGVLVLHAFGGCDPDFEGERAQRLAREGFIALATDVYGKGIRGGIVVAENLALIAPFFADRKNLLRRRLQASLKAFKTLEFLNTNKIGAIGWCFGGLCALDMARLQMGLLSAVSIHGTLWPLPEAKLEQLTTKIQVHHGDADPHIDAQQVNNFMSEMRVRRADWHFVSYGGAQHGFAHPIVDEMNNPGNAYDPLNDKRCWDSTVYFLKETLI